MKKHQCSPKFNHNNIKNNSKNRKIFKNKTNKNNDKKEDYDYIYGRKTIESPWFIKTPFPSRNKNTETHFDCRTNSNTTIKQLLSVPTYNSLSRQLLHKIYVIMVCCCFLIVSFHNGSPFQAHAFPMTTMAPTALLTSNSGPSTKISRDRDYRETSTRIRTAPGRKSYVFPTPIIDNNDKTLKNTHLRDDNSKQPHDYTPTIGNELNLELQDKSDLISAHRPENNGPWFPKRSRERGKVGREEKEVRKHHLNQNFEKLHQTDIHISKKRVKRKTLEILGNQIVKSTKLAINEQQLMSRSKRSLPSYSSYSNNNMLTNQIDQEVPTLNHYNLNYSSASLSHQTKYHPYHNAWKSVCESKQMFACHSLNKNGAVICIDDHNFCDGIYDCPQGEDEDPKSCLFRDNYLFHIRGLIDTMLVTLKED